MLFDARQIPFLTLSRLSGCFTHESPVTASNKLTCSWQKDFIDGHGYCFIELKPQDRVRTTQTEEAAMKFAPTLFIALMFGAVPAARAASTVAEPATLLLIGPLLAALWMLRRRRLRYGQLDFSQSLRK